MGASRVLVWDERYLTPCGQRLVGNPTLPLPPRLPQRFYSQPEKRPLQTDLDDSKFANQVGIKHFDIDYYLDVLVRKT